MDAISICYLSMLEDDSIESTSIPLILDAIVRSGLVSRGLDRFDQHFWQRMTKSYTSLNHLHGILTQAQKRSLVNIGTEPPHTRTLFSISILQVLPLVDYSLDRLQLRA